MIDFDYNATTPVKPAVRKAMEPFLEGKYGNPSSVHQVGQSPRAAVERARDRLARSLGTGSEELTLTASGSEANSFAIRGLLGPPSEDQRLITTEVEHSSVKETIEWYEANDATVDRIPLTGSGQLDISEFERMIDSDADLVSVMWVNNETGIVHPLEELGSLCREYGVWFHSDAIQAFGKLGIDFDNLPVDFMSVSAHKIGGPKGVGALLAPRDIELVPLVFGGHQERERRGGTENVAGVVGFGEASTRVEPEKFERLGSVRNQLEEFVRDSLGAHVLGRSCRRVGNTTGFVLSEVAGEDVVRMLDMRGYAVATGSACTSGTPQPSHVVEAMDLPDGFVPEGFVRVSLPPGTDQSTVEKFCGELGEVCEQLRNAGEENFDEEPQFSPVPGR